MVIEKVSCENLFPVSNRAPISNRIEIGARLLTGMKCQVKVFQKQFLDTYRNHVLPQHYDGETHLQIK